MIDRMDQDRAIVTRYLNDAEFQHVVFDALVRCAEQRKGQRRRRSANPRSRVRVNGRRFLFGTALPWNEIARVPFSSTARG